WTRDASNPASASPAFSPSKTIPSITHPIIPKIAKKPQNLTKDLTQYAFFSFYQFIINKEKRKNGKIQFDTSAQAPDSA
ncbi:MAG: FAM50/XAP5 family protein, partial [Candidatus Cloacimonetes bacterium]|nr:FAM50/XAP5 family protein [Candidatus Cloacimonadota bacterium]MCK9178138.1 FAM50/XAP5 family protein [Candidatus Cloacimonadota bacterium]